MSTALRLEGRAEAFAPKVILMDCDGVVFDVNVPKSDAFGEALAGYPDDLVARFVAHHKATGGVSRYEKFRWFFTELAPAQDAEDRIADALSAYATASIAAYEVLTPEAEAMDFIQQMGGPDRVWIVSGSDQDELRGVWRRHGISDTVVNVMGSPKKKRQHADAILEHLGLHPSEALMIGDGLAEFRVAQALRMPFVFLSPMTEWNDWRETITAGRDVTICATWADLLGRVSTI